MADSPAAVLISVDNLLNPELAGFVWHDHYGELISSLATTGLPPHDDPDSLPDWPTLYKILLDRLRHVVTAYLALGPRGVHDHCLASGQRYPGWFWDSEEVHRQLKRVADALAQFGASPTTPRDEEDAASANTHPRRGIASAPFTLQRFAELLSPQSPDQTPITHSHYPSLPKYIRAIQRVLAVTSSMSMFPEDTYALSSGEPDATSMADADQRLLSVNGAMPLDPTTSSPATVRPRRASMSSTPVTPTLSPIPWLTSIQSNDYREGRSSSPAYATGVVDPANSAAIPPHGVQNSPPLVHEIARSRALSPGSRVDELDPGLGTGGKMNTEPVAIGSTPLSPRVGPVMSRTEDNKDIDNIDGDGKDDDDMDVGE